MDGEGVSTGGSVTSFYLFMHQSLFFWVLLVVGLCYGAYAYWGHPWIQKIASMLLAVLIFGTLTELCIAIVWRVFFGNFSDVPTFEFSTFTLVDAVPCVLLVWPWGKENASSSKFAPDFDWLRAAMGVFFGVLFALLIAYIDTSFRVYRNDELLQFRGYFWFFFAVRGIGGAIFGGLLLGGLAGFLPRYQWAHAQLSKSRGGAAGGALVVLAVLIRLVGGAIVG